MTEEDMQRFLTDYARMNRAEGTVKFYRQKLRRFYDAIPADKTIRYGTLQKWRESLLQHGYMPGSVNAFLSAANSHLDYIDIGNTSLRGSSRMKNLRSRS